MAEATPNSEVVMGTIYKIVNIVNDKVYVGQTLHSAKRRFDCHMWASRQEGHGKKFHNAIKKHGAKNFTLIEVEKCGRDILDEREIFWIAYYDSYKNGYNSTTGGESGFFHSDETKEKIRQMSTGRKHSEETKKLISKIGMGRTHSDEAKKKISIAKTGNKYWEGKTHTDEYKQYMSELQGGENNPFYGKKHSEESRKKMSDNMTGKRMGKDNPYSKKVINIDTGDIFDTMSEAAKAYGILISGISACCKGNQNTVRGQRWEYYYEREVG